jgi:hypothetical protein
MTPKRNRPQRQSPDSLPEDSRTEIVQDKERSVGTAMPVEATAPEETAPDGGSAQHPIHDGDLEDRDSSDYERDVDQFDKVAALDVALRKRDNN